MKVKIKESYVASIKDATNDNFLYGDKNYV